MALLLLFCSCSLNDRIKASHLRSRLDALDLANSLSVFFSLSKANFKNCAKQYIGAGRMQKLPWSIQKLCLKLKINLHRPASTNAQTTTSYLIRIIFKLLTCCSKADSMIFFYLQRYVGTSFGKNTDLHVKSEFLSFSLKVIPQVHSSILFKIPI